MIDIDHFKLYNDTYGHQEGDICLKRVASALKSTLKRQCDVVAELSIPTPRGFPLRPPLGAVPRIPSEQENQDSEST